jgi:hypothetical protein
MQASSQRPLPHANLALSPSLPRSPLPGWDKLRCAATRPRLVASSAFWGVMQYPKESNKLAVLQK